MMAMEQTLERPKTGHGRRRESDLSTYVATQANDNDSNEKPRTSRASRPKSRAGRPRDITQAAMATAAASAYAKHGVVMEAGASALPFDHVAPAVPASHPERPVTRHGRRDVDVSSDAFNVQNASAVYERPKTSHGRRAHQDLNISSHADILQCQSQGSEASYGGEQDFSVSMDRRDRGKYVPHEPNPVDLSSSCASGLWRQSQGNHAPERPRTSKGHRGERTVPGVNATRGEEQHPPPRSDASQTSADPVVNILRIDHEESRPHPTALLSQRAKAQSHRTPGIQGAPPTVRSGTVPHGSKCASSPRGKVPCGSHEEKLRAKEAHPQPRYNRDRVAPSGGGPSTKESNGPPSPGLISSPLVPALGSVFTPLVPVPTSPLQPRPPGRVATGRRHSSGIVNTHIKSTDSPRSVDSRGTGSPSSSRPASSSSISRYNILPSIAPPKRDPLPASGADGGGGALRSILKPAGSASKAATESGNNDTKGGTKSEPVRSILKKQASETSNNSGKIQTERLTNGKKQNPGSAADPVAMTTLSPEALVGASGLSSSPSSAFKALTRIISLPPAPASTEPRILLAVKLPNGQRVQRYFKMTDQLETVVNYAELSAQFDFTGCELVQDVPRKRFADTKVTIQEASLKDRTMLHIQIPDD